MAGSLAGCVLGGPEAPGCAEDAECGEGYSCRAGACFMERGAIAPADAGADSDAEADASADSDAEADASADAGAEDAASDAPAD